MKAIYDKIGQEQKNSNVKEKTPSDGLPNKNHPSGRSVPPTQPPQQNTAKRMENILVVGTSLKNKLNKQVLKNVTDSNVTSVTAFTIDAKDGAVRPDLNHRNIVPAELSRKPFDTLVLEGGVNEISNMNTKKDFIDNIDSWKKEVADDSLNLYQLAEKSLAENPSLKKVIILKRIFRCDDNVKESLSQYANSVYDELWLRRGRPSGIYIADQKLQCDGALRVQRYGDPYYVVCLF